MHQHPSSASLLLCLALAACSAATTKDTNRDLGAGRRDAGEDPEEGGAQDELDASDGPGEDATTTDDADADAAADPGDTGADGGDMGSADAGSELDASGAPDAASDASVDASETEGGADAAGATEAGADAGLRNVIYASFGATLVRIDPDTAALEQVGLLVESSDSPEPFDNPVMTWSGAGDRALMVTSYYVSPTLASVNLCNARVATGVALSRANSPNLIVEGLALHPDGTVYVASGNPSDPVNNPLSPNLGRLDTETGIITNLGQAVSALQGDIDMLFFRGSALYGVDVVTNNSRFGLFTLDLQTGKDSAVVAPTYGASNQVPLRMAYDASRDKAFTWRPSDRNLLSIDLATGALTPIGETHAAGAFGGAPPRAFFVAPAPTSCPPADR